MNQLDDIADTIRGHFEESNDARDKAYQRSRQLTSVCARAIRAIHREEWEPAESLIAEAKIAADTLTNDLDNHPALYYAGYTQDALKEYVEAHLTYALVRDRPLLTPDELGTAENTWLNGLAEAATELRRRILDLIRHGYSPEVERLLDKMDEIYSILVTFDFNDSITGGLRRRTDIVRGVLERTRGDVTRDYRQMELEKALANFEQQVKGGTI